MYLNRKKLLFLQSGKNNKILFTRSSCRKMLFWFFLFIFYFYARMGCMYITVHSHLNLRCTAFKSHTLWLNATYFMRWNSKNFKNQRTFLHCNIVPCTLTHSWIAHVNRLHSTHAVFFVIKRSRAERVCTYYTLMEDEKKTFCKRH